MFNFGWFFRLTFDAIKWAWRWLYVSCCDAHTDNVIHVQQCDYSIWFVIVIFDHYKYWQIVQFESIKEEQNERRKRNRMSNWLLTEAVNVFDSIFKFGMTFVDDFYTFFSKKRSSLFEISASNFCVFFFFFALWIWVLTNGIVKSNKIKFCVN